MTLSNLILLLLCGWTLLFFGTFGVYIHSLTSMRVATRTLLRATEQTSITIFQFLHTGSVNSVFGIVPYVSINARRFSEFVGSDRLNEFDNVRLAKIEYKQRLQHAKLWLKAQLALLFVFVIAGIIVAILIEQRLI